MRATTRRGESERNNRARPGDLASELTCFSEQSHLVGACQHIGERITISGRETQALPERARPAAEQPRRARALLGSSIERESRKSTAAPSGTLCRTDSNAPDQRMATVAADLIPRAADDRAFPVTLDP